MTQKVLNVKNDIVPFMKGKSIYDTIHFSLNKSYPIFPESKLEISQRCLFQKVVSFQNVGQSVCCPHSQSFPIASHVIIVNKLFTYKALS